ncbi:hypothetical protein BJX62DRAFT_243539 [Aspergillus germanicus]
MAGTRNTNALWVQLILADQWFRNVQLKAVQTAFEPLEPTAPEDDEQRKEVELTQQAGDQALKGGRYDEAIELYSKAINLDSANVTTRYQKVSALLSKGIYSAAVQEASIAVRVVPKNVWAWHYLGIACLQAGCFSRATTSFETALALAEPGKVPAGLRDGLAMSHTEPGSAKAADERENPEMCWMAVSTISQQQNKGSSVLRKRCNGRILTRSASIRGESVMMSQRANAG